MTRVTGRATLASDPDGCDALQTKGMFGASANRTSWFQHISPLKETKTFTFLQLPPPPVNEMGKIKRSNPPVGIKLDWGKRCEGDERRGGRSRAKGGFFFLLWFLTCERSLWVLLS